MLEELVARKLEDLRHMIAELTHFHDVLTDAYMELGEEPAPDTCGPGCGCDVAVQVEIGQAPPRGGLVSSTAISGVPSDRAVPVV